VSTTSLWRRFCGRKFPAVLGLTLAVSLLAGCDSAQRTVDTLRKEIAEFQATPDNQKQALIEQHLAKLQDQVSKLEERKDAKAAEMRKQLASLRADYQSAKMAKALEDAKNAIQGFGEAIKDGAKSFSDAFKGSASPTPGK